MLIFYNLRNIIRLLKVEVTLKNQYLFPIIENNKLNVNKKIKILNLFSDEEINIKNNTGTGLIFPAIETSKEIFDYLLKT